MDRKILFVYYYGEEMRAAWTSCGFEVWEDNTNFTELPFDGLWERLTEYVEQYGVRYVFSYNYLPDLAEICFEKGLYYISWTVDAPHVVLWSKTTAYPTNRMFLFDAVQYHKLVDRGENNVWHLPLVANVESFTRTIENDKGASKEQYASDVAFLGNLYTDEEHSLYDRIQYMPPYLTGYLEALMYIQRQVWGIDLLEEGITPEVWTMLEKHIKCEWGTDYYAESYKMSIVNLLGQKLAQLERKEVCSYLARNFNFVLYTGSDTSFDSEICNKGYANYLKDMPLIFHYSKININITSRSIPSGIPQRVLDVLACGGFLLTNYQQEIVECFEDGKELVVYTDFQDMYDKISYYLVHEDERKQIAANGYRKVKEMFSVKQGVGKIVQMLEDTIEEQADTQMEKRCQMLVDYRAQLIECGGFDRAVLEMFQKAQTVGRLEEVKQMLMTALEKQQY